MEVTIQPTPAEYAAAQEWWNLMYAEFESVRFVDGEPEYQSPGEACPLDEVFTSSFILYLD